MEPKMTELDWQNEREMTPAEYRRVIKSLRLNTASAGRYLGVSTRTSHRYGRGETEIPAAQVLLLRSLAAHGETPVVPKWSADRNKHW
jgi:DNA-binding transcriptional regulator YiaG